MKRKKRLKKEIRTIFILLLVLIAMCIGIYFIVTHKKGKETNIENDHNVNESTNVELDDTPVEDKEETSQDKVIEDNKEEVKVEEEQTKKEEKKEEKQVTTTNSNTTSKGFKIEVKNGITYIDGILVVNKTYSLPSTYAPGLDSTVRKKADEMFAAAKLDGIDIYDQSGFRSYETQQRLYNNYVKSKGKEQADAVSARPGHSEHQSGLAFDVCGKDQNKCINSNFDNTPEAKWLAKNAYKYGFILRFVNGKTNETGYKYESWHYRYVGKELAEKLYNNGDWITLESYFGIDSIYK